MPKLLLKRFLLTKFYAMYSIKVTVYGSRFTVLRHLYKLSIVIASKAKQSHNTLISHKIATSRHALLAAKGSLAPRNDDN